MKEEEQLGSNCETTSVVLRQLFLSLDKAVLIVQAAQVSAPSYTIQFSTGVTTAVHTPSNG